MDDWRLEEADLERVEVFPWSDEAAGAWPFLERAVADFAAVEDKNASAAHEATKWLHDDARGQRAVATRLLVVDERIVSFYALSSAEMLISATQNLKEMGYVVPLAPPTSYRVGTSHIEVIARDRRAPAGAGRLAITHAFGIAEAVASFQGNRALTLDPSDQLTEAMWLTQGFRRTERTLLNGTRRLYAPVFGPYNGGLTRD